MVISKFLFPATISLLNSRLRCLVEGQLHLEAPQTSQTQEVENKFSLPLDSAFLSVSLILMNENTIYSAAETRNLGVIPWLSPALLHALSPSSADSFLFFLFYLNFSISSADLLTEQVYSFYRVPCLSLLPFHAHHKRLLAFAFFYLTLTLFLSSGPCFRALVRMIINLAEPRLPAWILYVCSTLPYVLQFLENAKLLCSFMS